MTRSKTPTNTKAPAERNADTEEPVTKLAVVNDPASLTAAKIDEIAGRHDNPTDPEQTANVDAAVTLEQNRAEARGKDVAAPITHGQGGAADI